MSNTASKTANESVVDLKPGKVKAEDPVDTVDQSEDRALVAGRPETRAVTTTGFSESVSVAAVSSRVKVAYAVSQNMPDDATEGSLVISTSDGGWVKLLAANATTPLTVLIVDVRKYFKEWLTSDAFNAGQRPRTYATPAEAVADGHRVTWDGDLKPTVSLAFDVHMLVKKPEDLTNGSEAFNLVIGDGVWAPCVMTVDKSGAQGANVFFTNLLLRDASQRKITVREASLSNVFCTLCVKAKPFKNNPSRKSRIPTFGILTDKDFKYCVPNEEFKQELKNIISCLTDPSKNATATEDDESLPF